MKKISFWACHHRFQARLLILLIYIFLNGIGLFLGDVLFSSGITIPAFLIYATCFAFVLACGIYPLKKDKAHYKNFYRRKKLTDLLLSATTFFLIISFGNHYNNTRAILSSPYQSVYALESNPAPTYFNEKFNKAEPGVKKKSGIKSLKQKLRENIRLLRKEYKNSSNGEKTALIILSILVAIALLFLLAALSCSIACGGAEGAAIVVALLGTALIIFLLAKVIKGINRGKPKKEIPATPITG